jgi:CRP/FNR family cyclic AMP-dependent transcriptional regulator
MAAHVKPISEEVIRKAQEFLVRWRMPPQSLGTCIENRATITFSKGRAIFTCGSPADVTYLIISGVVKIYLPLEDGTRVIVRIAGAGEFVGFIDTIGPSGRRVQALEAEAMTTVSAAIITRDHLRGVIDTLTPAGLAELLEDINTSWSEGLLWSVKFLGLSFRDRLVAVLQYLGDRYGVRESRGILLTLELSHEELAQMIASSRAMVSRLVAEFMESGELARQGRHYILVKPASAVPVVSTAEPVTYRDPVSSVPSEVSAVRAIGSQDNR